MSKQAADHMLPRKRESWFPPLLFLSESQMLHWFAAWG